MYPMRSRVCRRNERGRSPSTRTSPGARREAAGDHPDRGGLAGAGRSDDAEHRAERDLERDVVERHQLTERLADIAHPDGGRATERAFGIGDRPRQAREPGIGGRALRVAAGRRDCHTCLICWKRRQCGGERRLRRRLERRGRRRYGRVTIEPHGAACNPRVSNVRDGDHRAFEPRSVASAPCRHARPPPRPLPTRPAIRRRTRPPPRASPGFGMSTRTIRGRPPAPGTRLPLRHARRTLVRDPATLRRFRALAIPPAWTNVWICPNPSGHIQATGRDARGRKQYRYHPRWREVRDETKYDRMIQFGEALPGIRERVDEDLARPGLPREKVLAAVVRLLELTFIRVGNEEYARLNSSFGLTTLRDRHVAIEGSHVRFRFRGKSGKPHETGIRDRRLARIIRACQELPGQTPVPVRRRRRASASRSARPMSTPTCAKSRARTSRRRTSAPGPEPSSHSGRCARSTRPPRTPNAKRTLVAAIKDVAGRLGNTPAVCRKSYVHPGVVDAYLAGDLGADLVASAERSGDPGPDARTRARRRRCSSCSGGGCSLPSGARAVATAPAA